MDFKAAIEKRLEQELDMPVTLEVPKNTEMADYAFPCFRLAKQFHKAPKVIAEELKEKLGHLEGVTDIQAVNGYVNFFIDPTLRAKAVLSAINQDYGRQEIGNGRAICIDYSSINIAKPFHIGHLSTTAIGHALYRIFGFLGYKCIGINYLGDYGTQFGKMIVAFKLWGDRDAIERGGIREMYQLYVRFHKEAEEKPELDDQARAWFKKIEDGDEEALSLFHWFKERTLQDVQKIYADLDITFDSFNGESYYNDKMEPVIDELRDKGLLVESEGAYVVPLGDTMPPCLILKKDGATLYATRDLAAAIDRKRTYDFDQSLYVVAYQQDLHFKQVFAVLERMGYPWAKDCHHVAFGMTSMEEGTLSTRKGKVIFLEDILDQAVEKTLATIKAKNPGLAGKEQVAKDVGVGAVVFSALSGNRINDTVFSYDRVLSFEGETGPYIQYTHARCCSLLEKGAMGQEPVDYALLSSHEEGEIIRLLGDFPKVIQDAAEKYEPCFVARYLLSLCAAFNHYYFDHRIITEDTRQTAARLRLTACVKQTVQTGLYLLGMKAPEHM